MRLRRAVICAAVMMPLLCGPGVGPVAQADSVDDAKHRVEIAAGALEDSTAAVQAAGASLVSVANQLPGAQQEVAVARGELAGAQARAAEADLLVRRAELSTATAERHVQEATARVASGRETIAVLARRSYQQGPLGDLREVFRNGTPQDVVDRAETLKHVFRGQNDVLHVLSVDRLHLARTSAELAVQQQQLEAARATAVAGQERAATVAAQADQAAAHVQALIDQRRQALAQAEASRGADVAEYKAANEASRALAARIRALAKKRAAERAARARARAVERAAARRAAQAEARRQARARRAANQPAAPEPPPLPDPAPQDIPPAVGRFGWPADGPLTSPFGYRMHPIFHVLRFHAGIDIGAGYGAPVSAAAGGTVIFAGVASGYGTLVVIDHGTVDGRDIATAYAHMSALLVYDGQQVGPGQQVGRVGNEGNSTGPHLHFEVRRDGDPVDPLNWVSPP